MSCEIQFMCQTPFTHIYICVCDDKSMKNNIEAHLVGDFPGNEGLVCDRLNLIQVFFVLGQEYSKRKKIHNKHVFSSSDSSLMANSTTTVLQ